MRELLKKEIIYESDIVTARQRASQIATLLGFEAQDQARIVASVSELVRNILQYAGRGVVRFLFDPQGDRSLVIRCEDEGPGISDLSAMLAGTFAFKPGTGLGLSGTRRVMDDFRVESELGRGTSVQISKKMPKHRPAFDLEEALLKIAEIDKSRVGTPLQELRDQNQQLLRAMNVLEEKQLELANLNRELENTNRGVVALYAELDEKAESLRRANAAKTSFLSNMTHEFRSPLNSILNLSEILLDSRDGVRDPEHQKQVSFIRKSAQELSDLVNDLLDLAKVEAGKIAVRASAVSVDEIFGTLRGLMRPLVFNNLRVNLIIPETSEIELWTDGGKLSQILRNLVSNALKYTTEGVVEVQAECVDEEHILFSVRDTGIGISIEDQSRIFEEFFQVESSLQRRVRGTGLGLPLAHRLGRLLGGNIRLESQVGVGSTFYLEIPHRYSGPSEADYISEQKRQPVDRPVIKTVLVIDDEIVPRRLTMGILKELGFDVTIVESGASGLEIIRNHPPHLIILDLVMPGMTGDEVINILRHDAVLINIPIILTSSISLDAIDLTALVRDNVIDFLPKTGSPRQEMKDALREMLLRHGFLAAEDF